MSRWWCNKVRIVLHPRQLALVRLRSNGSHRVTDQRIICCDKPAPGQFAWHRALDALEAVLPDFADRPADTDVVLSNHFVRYTLIPFAQEVVTAGEEQAFVRHHFERIFGAQAEGWQVSISGAERPREPRVACAVDRELCEALRSVLQPTRLKLRSIQPYLMAAFNPLRRRITSSAWLAVVEPGHLCLVRFLDKRWHTIKSLRTGDDWLRDLALQLEREEFLLGRAADDPDPRDAVFVFAPGYPEPDPQRVRQHASSLLQDHTMRLLWPSPAGDGTTIDEPSYAMALVG